MRVAGELGGGPAEQVCRGTWNKEDSSRGEGRIWEEKKMGPLFFPWGCGLCNGTTLKPTSEIA